MRLDDITTNIRLRNAWEAIDLGFAMVQYYWKAIYPAWTLLLFSFAFTLWFLTPSAYKMYVLFVLWWFKPLYDRILLFIFSQQLFNQPLSTADVVSALPKLITKTGLFQALTFRRFSLSRGLNLPIWQLEQLRGKARRERQSLLHLQAHSQAVWLTIACSHFEYIFLFSFYALIVLVDPTETAWTILKSPFDEFADESIKYWGDLIYTLTYLLIYWVIEPLYMAASFSLYLNRRTQLEAWDIELAFRSLADRLRGISYHTFIYLFALGLSLSLVYYTPPVVADEATQSDSKGEYLAPERLPASASAEQIKAVMSLDEFQKVRKEQEWQRKNKEEEEEIKPPNKMLNFGSDFQILVGTIVRTLLWISLIVLLVLLFVYRHKIIAMLKPNRPKPPAAPPPDVLFGMDIRPESLPDDIAGASRTLWEQGQYREALSLLYRGALMRLTRHDLLEVHSSHTEGDILQLAKQQLAGQRLAWLTAVTLAWQEIAYAHRRPNDERIYPLFKDWVLFATPEPISAEQVK
jgi:hypothetical protein